MITYPSERHAQRQPRIKEKTMDKEEEIRMMMRKHGFNRAAEEAEVGQCNIDYVRGCWRLRDKMQRPVWTQFFGE